MPKPSLICFACEFNERRVARAEGRPAPLVCRCMVSGEPITTHTEIGYDCPKGFFDGPPTPLVQIRPLKTPPVARAQRIAEVGPALWQELHEYAAKATTLEGASEFLDGWARRLPCGSCRSEWRNVIQDAPPIMVSPYLFFLWTWKAHNAINARLGKPEFGKDHAIALYYSSDHTDVENEGGE